VAILKTPNKIVNNLSRLRGRQLIELLEPVTAAGEPAAGDGSAS
jgi:hypothetical protein